MRPEIWQRVKEIVADALEQAPDKRDEFVVTVCGGDETLRREVMSMLDQTTGRLETCAEELSSVADQNGAIIGTRLGAYEILREIGRGGMGAVYLAARADREFEKDVAIKILKRGTDTDEVLRRFRAERQILARFEHPNIARLIDAGTTRDGLPYFVMEYVDGERITDFCRARRLDVRERIELFLKICGAIHFAHRNLIVHRDLKPANILVTAEGEPKLLDFGIAKILSSDSDFVPATITLQGRQRLTPGYASPEQVRGEPVTTVSDVYSLGALLFELLAGQSPHRFSSPHPTETELIGVIVEQEAPRLSAIQNLTGLTGQVSNQLRGDLDNILSTALRKEPEHRYSGVTALSEDLQRYLEGRPIHARPATIGNRAGKFVRRNKIAVAATIIVILSLVGGTIVSTWNAAIARAERAKAQAQFQMLRKSARTMIWDIHGALINLPGSLDARKLLLQRATEQLDALAASAGEDQLLQVDLADAYQNIGYLPDKTLAERSELFEKAIALDQKVLAKEPRNIGARENLAMSEISLADFARARGDIEEAFKYNRDAIALLESVVADEPTGLGHKTLLWNASYNAGLTLMQTGRAAEALEIGRRIYPVAAELREKHSADQSDNKFRRPYLSRALMADSLIYLGHYDEAIKELRAALGETAAVRRKYPLGSAEKLDESVFNYHLATALERNGQSDEAIQTMRTSLELGEKLMSDEPRESSYRTSAAVENAQLGFLLLRANHATESIQYFRRAIELYEQILSGDPGQKQANFGIAYAHGGLGYAMAKTGEIEQALAAQRKAVALYENIEPVKTPNVSLLHDYADTLARAGETHLVNQTKESTLQARQLFQRSLDVWNLMRDRGTLSKAGAKRFEEVAQQIAKM